MSAPNAAAASHSPLVGLKIKKGIPHETLGSDRGGGMRGVGPPFKIFGSMRLSVVLTLISSFAIGFLNVSWDLCQA